VKEEEGKNKNGGGEKGRRELLGQEELDALLSLFNPTNSLH